MNKSRTFLVGAVCVAMTSIGGLGQPTVNRPAPPRTCVNNDSVNSWICISMVSASFGAPGTPDARVTLSVHFIDIDEAHGTEPDFYQIRFSEASVGTGTGNYLGLTYVSQDSVVGKAWEGNWKKTMPYLPGVEGPPYLIQVQLCTNGGLLAGADCGSWANVTYTPPPPHYIPPPGAPSTGPTPNATNQHAAPRQTPPAGPNLAEVPRPCSQGYVWRQALAMDYVCVTPQTRAQAAADNDEKVRKQRAAPNDMCIQGYVWRETVPQDHICVTPQTRAQAQQDNAAMNQRVASQRAPQ